MANLRRPQATDSPVLSLRQPAGESQRGGGPGLSEMVSLASFLREPAMQAQEQKAQQAQIQQRQQGRQALQQDKQQFETEKRQEGQKFEIAKENYKRVAQMMKEQNLTNPEGAEITRQVIESSPEIKKSLEPYQEVIDVMTDPELYQTSKEEAAQRMQEAKQEAERRAEAEQVEYEAKESLREEQLQDEIEAERQRFESLASVRKGEQEEELEMERQKTQQEQQLENRFVTIKHDDGTASVRHIKPRQEPPENATPMTTEKSAQSYADSLNKIAMIQKEYEYKAEHEGDKSQIRAAENASMQTGLRTLANMLETYTVDKKDAEGRALKKIPNAGTLKSNVLSQHNYTKADIEDIIEDEFYRQSEYRGMRGETVEMPSGDFEGTKMTGPQVKRYWDERVKDLNTLLNRDRLEDKDLDLLKQIWYAMLTVDSPEILDYVGKHDDIHPAFFGGEKPLVLKYQDPTELDGPQDIDLTE